jgi:tetratricopeptide (TPR) repeat protein
MLKKFFSILSAIVLIGIICGHGQEQKKAIPITTKSKEALEYYQKALDAWYESEKETVENFQKAISLDPGFVMARAQYSIFLSNPENLQMIEEAKQYFPEVTEGEKLFTLVMEAWNKREWNKGIEMLEQLAKEYPDDAVVHFRLAWFYYMIKNFDKAVEERKKAIACDPHFYGAYQMLGYDYIGLGSFDEAIKWFKKYAELLPHSAMAWVSLGKAYRNAGNYKEAVKSCQKALTLQPGFADALINLGDIKQELGYYEEAVPYYKDALKTLLPEKKISQSHFSIVDSFWRIMLANNYIYMGELQKAEGEAKTIIQLDSRYTRIYGYYLLAEIALKSGDVKRAAEQLKIVQKLEKQDNFTAEEKHQIANFLQAKIYLAEEDLNSAERFILAAVTTFPKEGKANLLSSIYPLGSDRYICVEPLNLLAELRKKQNRIDDEIEAIEKSLQLIPYQPELHFRLGEIYSQQNKKEEAAKSYKMFLTLCQDFKCLPEAKKKAKQFIKDYYK